MLWCGDEASLDGIAVHVTKFLNVLGLGNDVEVVVSSQPETFVVAFDFFGHRCLEHVKGCSELIPLWLGEQQVDMLWHKDIAKDEKTVTDPELFEVMFEGDSNGITIQ